MQAAAAPGPCLACRYRRVAGATGVAGLPLHSVADLDGVVVRIGAGRRAIDRDALAAHDVAGRSVLVHTGFDRYWGTPSSPLPPPAAWPSSRPHWPASTRSTSTTPATRRARRTRRWWRLASPSGSPSPRLTSPRPPGFASPTAPPP